MKVSTRFGLVASVALILSLEVAMAQQQPAQPAPPQLPQAPNMTFFVVGNGPGKGADLGGIEGADRHCQQLAEAARRRREDLAGLSRHPAGRRQAGVNARDRIGNGPWQNFKGQVVATSLDDLRSDNNKLGFDNSLTRARPDRSRRRLRAEPA